MKEVTQLDDSGFFVGFTSADESPLEEGVYHLPRNSVEAPELPTLGTGERAKWVDGEWLIVPPEPIPEPIPEQTIEQERATMQMSRQKFAVVAAGEGWLSDLEAEDWAAGVSIPSIASNAINSRPIEERLALRIQVRSQAIIRRNDMLIGVLMAQEEVPHADMDRLFRNT